MPNRPCGRISSTIDHREIDQKQRDALEIGLAERVGDADQQAADERAAQAAHAADHDDDESRNENFGVHSRIEAEHRRRRDAAERGERDAEARKCR